MRDVIIAEHIKWNKREAMKRTVKIVAFGNGSFEIQKQLVRVFSQAVGRHVVTYDNFSDEQSCLFNQKFFKFDEVGIHHICLNLGSLKNKYKTQFVMSEIRMNSIQSLV
jgi:hypothetical protein